MARRLSTDVLGASEQRGGFLLEALIGILIFAFGILGIIGLQARSLKLTNESQLRAEAVYLTNALFGRMWSDNLATLEASYDKDFGSSGFVSFRDAVFAALPNADADVQVNRNAPGDPPLPSKNSAVVYVRVSWQSPGEDPHQYETFGIIGKN